MKKIILSCILLTQLSGCAAYNVFRTARYDDGEYTLINKVRTVAQLGKCDTTSVNDLYVATLELKNYSEYLPHNDKTISMTNNLFIIVEELNKKEDINSAYCQAKLNIVSTSAEEIQKINGSKNR
jgi:hypothetical protein